MGWNRGQIWELEEVWYTINSGLVTTLVSVYFRSLAGGLTGPPLLD
jgi:hypothetical protein